jgi:zinc protease
MDIGDYTESIDASCSPSDIETMFQLLYLKMTTVRKDSVAFLSMIAQQKGILENRLSVPENIFRDTVSYIMSGYNPRSKPMTIEMLSKLDMNRALQLYKKRFSDASDFTFTLVGNFDIATIKPLIETYLGGLPSTYKKENFRDLGVSQPLGKIEKEVKKGVEPKSSVAIKYNGTFKYDRKSRFEMNALLKLLSIKLRENLREEKGGVYGVGAFPSMKKMPKGYYEITIGFGCAPTNVKTLVDACEVEIKAIKANGCDDKNLTKVRETFLRERETYLKENSFWLNLISRSALDGESIDEIKDYNNWVKSLTSDDFKQLANRYLTNESYKLFVLNPIN